jgi:hypothetical protein
MLSEDLSDTSLWVVEGIMTLEGFLEMVTEDNPGTFIQEPAPLIWY